MSDTQINIHNAQALGGTYSMPLEDAERLRELLTEAGTILDKARGFETVLNIDVWPYER